MALTPGLSLAACWVLGWTCGVLAGACGVLAAAGSPLPLAGFLCLTRGLDAGCTEAPEARGTLGMVASRGGCSTAGGAGLEEAGMGGARG